MINFMTPVMAANNREVPSVSWLALLWRRRHPRDPETTVPARKILEVVNRVRGVEAALARLKMEAKCNGS